MLHLICHNIIRLSILLASVSILVLTEITMENKNLMIIDTDGGIDDAAAITLGISKMAEEKFGNKVMAITTVSGNVELEKVNLNVARILTACNKQNIPIYHGSNYSIMNHGIDGDGYDGADGFGGVGHEFSDGGIKIQNEHAVLKLIELSKQYYQKITLVCLGPLTNLALALRMNPEVATYFKEVIIMGGNIDGVGNVSPSAEFNFLCDPEAADIVLTEIKSNITIIPWETCHYKQYGWTWKQYDDWLKNRNDTKAHFLKRISEMSVNRMKKLTDGVFHSADSWAMAVSLDKTVVKKSLFLHARVETIGRFTTGQMVADKREYSKETPNANIITGIDPGRIWTLMNEIFD